MLQALPQPPDLVVSGINFGQNVGELVNLSGTVGAALWAARLGIPAIAVSHGFVSPASQYTESASYTAELVERFRAEPRLPRQDERRARGARFALVLNINFPTCTSGSTRGVVLVPAGTHAPQVTGYTLSGTMGSTQTFTPSSSRSDPFAANCLSTLTDPATDVDGLHQRLRHADAAQPRPHGVAEDPELPLPRLKPASAPSTGRQRRSSVQG